MAAAAAAAAALRYATRRLGGRALQCSHRNYSAAADDIVGGRTVRPTSSRRSRSSASYGTTNGKPKHACAEPDVEPVVQKSEENLASTQQKEIDNKKEELFCLIAKMDTELPFHCGRDNRQLLVHLSILVQPKPDDPQWRFYRRAARFNKYFLYGAMLSLGYMAVSDEISQVYAAIVD